MAGHAIPGTSQFLLFSSNDQCSDLVAMDGMVWFVMLVSECACGFFFHAQMDADGHWVTPVGTLSTFVKTANLLNCPELCTEPYTGVAHTSVGPAKVAHFCLFCRVAIALARIRNHGQ